MSTLLAMNMGFAANTALNNHQSIDQIILRYCWRLMNMMCLIVLTLNGAAAESIECGPHVEKIESSVQSNETNDLYN